MAPRKSEKFLSDRCWEFPMTRTEKMTRVVQLFQAELDTRDAELARRSEATAAHSETGRWHSRALELRSRARSAAARLRQASNQQESMQPAFRRVWESPVLLVPLSHMRGGLFAGAAQLGEPVATVAVSFLVDTDPETILAATEAPTLQQVSADLAERAEGFMRQVYEIPTPLGWFNFDSQGQEEVTGLRTMTPNETMEASERARERSDQVPDPGLILLAPDVQPEGWIRRKGPHGRYHWHHRSLGLAPWELEEPSAELPKSSAQGAKPRFQAPSLPRVAEDSPLSPRAD
eukprot:s760_g2.t1